MNTDIGKCLRKADFVDSTDGHGLLFDTSMASCVGAAPGLEDLSQIFNQVNICFDGIIVNPGQAEHQAEFLGGKNKASPVVRVDWTNAFRDDDFCLPVSDVKWLMISDGQDALAMGASAVLAGLYMGFDDDFEANNIQNLSRLARECHSISMPVIIDIYPIGGKITPKNEEESIKLGVSFMQELGADVLIIPGCTPENYRLISQWMQIPVLMRGDTLPSGDQLKGILDAGLAGMVLTDRVCCEDNFIKSIRGIYSMIHDRGSV